MLHQLRGNRIPVDFSALGLAADGSYLRPSIMSVGKYDSDPLLTGGVLPTVLPSTRPASKARFTDNMDKLEEFSRAADILAALPIHFLRFFGSTDVDKVLDALE
jgi:hypothetical protein